MKTDRVEDVDKLIKKVTGTPFTAKMSFCVFIVSLIGFISGLFLLASDTKLAIVLLIICGIMSLSFFLIFFFQKRGARIKRDSIDIDELRRELMGKVTFDDWKTTYFTEHYLVANYHTQFAVKYTDILWVYQRDYTDPSLNYMHHDIAIRLKNGKTEIILAHKLFIDEIVKRNKNILVGKTKENKIKYKELVNRD